MVKVGDTIKIKYLVDEPFNSNYIGRTGVVETIETDPYGEKRMGGTWGGIYIYINQDQFEIIKKVDS